MMVWGSALSAVPGAIPAGPLWRMVRHGNTRQGAPTMSERITQQDLKRAVEGHRDALHAAGITFEGRLILDIGSKTYGRAYRLNLTDVPDRCQAVRWLPDAAEGFSGGADHAWDHADCDHCHGTRVALCSGHYAPPVGSDFLGMTAREAYETLTGRTRTIYDMVRAQDAALKDEAPLIAWARARAGAAGTASVSQFSGTDLARLCDLLERVQS